MGLRLRKAQLETKPKMSEVNVVKRFGAKLRKAFNKKKEVCNYIGVHPQKETS